MEYGNPYLIMRQGDADWSLLYDPIQGFDYEEGYEYLIRVEVWNVEHPTTDQYIKNYKLLEVLSKEKKDSNVPEESRGFNAPNLALDQGTLI